MNTYQLVQRKTRNTNTPEHGFGDYPETIWKEWATVEAEDEKHYNLLISRICSLWIG